MSAALMSKALRKFVLGVFMEGRPARFARDAMAVAITVAGLCATSASAQAPSHLWSQAFGSTGGESGLAATVDGSGNVLLTGNFSGTVDFGGGDLVSTGSFDIFVAKYNSDGVHQWSQHFGSSGSDYGYAVAVDGSNNVLLTGRFTGTVDFGGGNLMSAGGNDIFVAKYNSAGAYQWSQSFGSTGDDIGYGIAVDGSGNVILAGHFVGTVDFGGGDLMGAGNLEIFAAKYNAAGVHQWSHRFGSTGVDLGLGVAADASGNVLLTGRFLNTVDFGGSDLESAGGQEIFVAKYNAAGVHQWSQRFGSTGNDSGLAAAVDGLGNVLLTGYFVDTVDFGGGNRMSAGAADIFVAKYNAAGVHQWSQRFGNTASDLGQAVAVDGSGNVLVTGNFDGTVDFGGGNFVSAESNDIFVARYNSDGVHQWSQRFGSTGNDSGEGVVADGSGDVLLTGYFGETVDFGGENLVSAGVGDIFLAKYTSPVTGADETPEPYELSVSAYPNPFNPGTTVRYTLPGSGRVTIGLYDVRGARVATLLDEMRPAGAYTLSWDAQNELGEPVGSGVYFARLSFGGRTRSYKLVLLE